MSHKPKLSAWQVSYIRLVTAIRRSLPTQEQLARECGVTPGMIAHVADYHVYKQNPRSLKKVQHEQKRPV
jgi:hypothetical protein